MYPQHLNTNEVKDRLGAEVEFTRIDSPNGKGLVFQRTSTLGTAYPTILTIRHDVQGVGDKRVRRSVVRVDKTQPSETDPTKTVVISDYWVKVVPEGHLTSQNSSADNTAMLMSNVASKGTTTTILFDGTGYGAEALLSGSY